MDFLSKYESLAKKKQILDTVPMQYFVETFVREPDALKESCSVLLDVFIWLQRELYVSSTTIAGHNIFNEKRTTLYLNF